MEELQLGATDVAVQIGVKHYFVFDFLEYFPEFQIFHFPLLGLVGPLASLFSSEWYWKTLELYKALI